ncbi:hypothetical protein [Caldichromatium japonicum]|nr:hypothetical protein [Caldichromatium japonicum]
MRLPRRQLDRIVLVLLLGLAVLLLSDTGWGSLRVERHGSMPGRCA